ncbi:MAG: aromatic ring-hydroxylating dioxygenase subunit alpha [Ardenticatenales bacterium]|nr:aromatic ring-hydroxylating dioxygenase subunit alpha [Ardenticatenales bacterium]
MQVVTWPTFPSHFYYDPARYELELNQIWYRHWIYVGRASSLAGPRSFRTLTIGDENVILLRDASGQFQAFYNVCRHRGALLCPAESGQLETRSLVCPYHAWSYGLDGKLQGVPFVGSPAKLPAGDRDLFPVACREWAGNLFISLADEPPPFEAAFEPDLHTLDNWPLADLEVGHSLELELACNWKIFWENFQECYHCPGVHPELCDMVPLYKRAVSDDTTAHALAELGNDTSNLPPMGLREGASTWSMDGQIHGDAFHNLSEEERAIGYKYLVCLPTMFVAAHPDYIRIVSVWPLGPEKTRLSAEWLFPSETLAHPEFDLQNVIQFGQLVLEQDGAVCELNQRGLRARKFQQGELMPHEYDVLQFLDWVKKEMGEL